MSTLYERFARTDDGPRFLAVARLKREVLRALNVALRESGVSQNELAARLKIRKSGVSQALRGDGNLQVKTVAEYLEALGFELDVRLVRAGEPRRALTEGRDVVPAFPRVPAKAAPSDVRTDIAVIPGSTDLLVNVTTWRDVGDRGTMHFRGTAHSVRRPATFTPMDGSVKIKPIASQS
ncbi:helix-turn-helix domain-containing protein [Kitasatospora sp. NBC_00240]|uniref:helix-turn-helix domain-containing protein n=1 Tax=Kitasatospora sp. NBC_00240 TaxID=2903567 RepID=UPI002259FD6C|nr:helix-turn-helix transcriptional regulator [Kitasatospora sp. NBC_00240]MCX5209832.1 helix-turn-helix domain-containing protein [Kitasatospora sp. NBC_00240]